LLEIITISADASLGRSLRNATLDVGDCLRGAGRSAAVSDYGHTDTRPDLALIETEHPQRRHRWRGWAVVGKPIRPHQTSDKVISRIATESVFLPAQHSLVGEASRQSVMLALPRPKTAYNGFSRSSRTGVRSLAKGCIEGLFARAIEPRQLE
jgi:hypothetical protein